MRVDSLNSKRFFRIASSSTQLKSVLLPSLHEFLTLHPDIHFEALIQKPQEIVQKLRAGNVDLALLDRPFHHPQVEVTPFGYEKHVLIEPTQPLGEFSPFRNKILLDEFSEELVERFFEIQKENPDKPETLFQNTRCFFGDQHSVIEGVALGLGCAVVPLHLIRHDHRVQRAPGFKYLVTPTYLHVSQTTLFPDLHQSVLKVLKRANPTELSQA